MELSLFVYLLLPALLFHLVYQYIKPRHDSREPPALPSKIPIIGHLAGLYRQGTVYFKNNKRRNDFPIFTIDFGVKKIYVVTASKFVPSIQRNSSKITLDPLLDIAANRMAGITGPGLEKLSDSGDGKGGLNKLLVHAMQPALLGPALNKMNRVMASNLSEVLDNFAVSHIPSERVDLMKWCRHAVYAASAEATWGPQNPFNDPAIVEALCDYDGGLSTLAVNILPSITARKAYSGREKVVSAFIRYLEAGGQHASSELFYARWKTQHEAGCSVADIARLESATAIAVLSNTVATAFRTILDVYSRPVLLAQLREEITQNALQIDPTTKTRTLNLALLKDACPMLVSTFQEVLRFRSQSSPMRFVKSDVFVSPSPTRGSTKDASNDYLLKKGSILFMPSESINFEPSVWGDDASTFNPMRFCKPASTPQNQDQDPEKPVRLTVTAPRPSSFMAWGVSPGLCPGRHFASGEIFALVAMVVLRFDITPQGSGVGEANGKWEEPKRLNTKAVATTIPPPVDPFWVKIAARKDESGGVEGEREVGWKVSTDESREVRD